MKWWQTSLFIFFTILTWNVFLFAFQLLLWWIEQIKSNAVEP